MCRDPGLNQGPSDLQSDALPTELSRLVVSICLLVCILLLFTTTTKKDKTWSVQCKLTTDLLQKLQEQT